MTSVRRPRLARITLAMVTALLFAGFATATASADKPTGYIAQLAGNDGCMTETETDGEGGTCAKGHLLDELQRMTMSPDGRFVYTSATGSDHGGTGDVEGIAAFLRNPDTGVLTQVGGDGGCYSTDGSDGTATWGCTLVPGLEGVKGMAISPDGRHLYATGESGILGFSRNVDTGVLTQDAGCVNPPGVNGCETGRGVDETTAVLVSRDGAHVYVAGRTGPDVDDVNAIATFNRDAVTGKLTQLPLPAGCISHRGADGCRYGQALWEPLDLVQTRNQRFVYVASSEGCDYGGGGDLGCNDERGSISALKREPDGSLSDGPCIGHPDTGCVDQLGFGLTDAMSVVLSPDESNLYVAGQGYCCSPPNTGEVGTLTVLRTDRNTGHMDFMQCWSEDGGSGLSGSDGDCGVARGVGEASDVAISRDGVSVYVAGGNPYQFCCQTDGGGAAIFSRDATTGLLTQLPGGDGCVTENGVGCDFGRAVDEAGGVLITPGCDNVYIGTHAGAWGEVATPVGSSVTAFSRQGDCRPVSAASAGDCTNTTATFSVTDRAGWSGAKDLHYRVDGGAEQIARTTGGVTGTVAVSLPDGRHSVEFWGVDEAGAVEKTHHTASVLTDKTAPTITITSDQKRSRYSRGQRATVTIKASDTGTGLATDPSAAKQRVSSSKNGRYSVTKTATDKCGNAATKTFNYRVVNPRLSIKVTPTRVNAGDRTTFSFRVTALGKAVSGATVIFGDNRATTNRKGRATITTTLSKTAKARAAKKGYSTSKRRTVKAKA
jgi:hypothetical protein